MKRYNFIIGLLFFHFLAQAQEVVEKPDKPNILFIMVDDLRPELGCYGETQIKSPNIDRLAMSGVVFANSYANYPVCGPSRASVLSGIYPGSRRFIGWNCSQDRDTPGLVSLPMYFRNNNYQTVSLGKVYNNFDDGKGSWDRNWRPPVSTTLWDYQSKEGIEIFEKRNKNSFKDVAVGGNNKLPKRGVPYEKPDVPDIAYKDGKIADRAIEELQGFQNNDQPFFLAVGFLKPHLPFNAPKKYWDLYNEDDIILPSNPFSPANAPEAAMFNWPELRAFYGIPPTGPLPDSITYNLIHGYYACVSYVDAQIGKLINALEDLDFANNTIIVLLGDHGWFLGEHGFWCKQSNFERAAHTPLILRVPWKNQGVKTEALVEFVDIYPTLCELVGLPQPFHLQGLSFSPLIDKPDQSWKKEIFYRQNGETVLTKTHTYTEWIDYNTGLPYARMLYDRQADPEENTNISELPENSNLIKSLHGKLHEHIKSRDKADLK